MFAKMSLEAFLYGRTPGAPFARRIKHGCRPDLIDPGPWSDRGEAGPLPSCRSLIEENVFSRTRVLGHSSGNVLLDAVRPPPSFLEVRFPKKRKLNVLFFLNAWISPRGADFEQKASALEPAGKRKRRSPFLRNEFAFSGGMGAKVANESFTSFARSALFCDTRARESEKAVFNLSSPQCFRVELIAV